MLQIKFLPLCLLLTSCATTGKLPSHVTKLESDRFTSRYRVTCSNEEDTLSSCEDKARYVCGHYKTFTSFVASYSYRGEQFTFKMVEFECL